MNKKEQWWDTKHDRYASEDWISKPTIFARWVIAYLPKNGRLLDIAAGHGQDSVYFAKQGFSVIATDFSEKAIQYINKNITPDIKGKITTQKVDLSKKLTFEDNMFDIVYGHLAVHYFTNKITDKVFKELKRILKPGGIIALLVNSTKDPEYKTGRKIEEDYFELSPGDFKHFFTIDYMRLKSRGLEEVFVDDNGTTYKDNAKGVFNLIRYVGKKVS